MILCFKSKASVIKLAGAFSMEGRWSFVSGK